MKSLHMVAWILVMIGGINWLLIGVGGFIGSDWNVVHFFLGSLPTIEWLVYILVGVSAVYEIVMHRSMCKECSAPKPVV